MTISRQFLDWNQPCLPQAVDWLIKLAADQRNTSKQELSLEATLDMSSFTVVAPGSRAGRRLREILVDKATGLTLAMAPPSIVTLSSLPETLYHPQKKINGDLASWVFRAEALSQVSSDLLTRLRPHPPKANDPLAMLWLAKEIHQLADELSAYQLTFSEIASRINDLVDTDDQDRWQALAQMDERYHDLLEAHGRADVHTERQSAIENNRLNHDGPVVLIAVTDLPSEHAAMLEALDCPVHVLIHGDPDRPEDFDALGRPVASQWLDRTAGLKRQRVHLVDRPAEQAYELSHTIHEIHKIDPLSSADQITIGLGDPALAPQIERTLNATGVPSRLVTGRTIDQSLPAVVLATLAELLSKQTTRELALALRCPPIEARVREAMGRPGQLLLKRLDWYINERLVRRLHEVKTENLSQQSDPEIETDFESSKSREAAQTVSLAWQTLRELLPENADQRALLASWREPIAAILQTFFGQRELERLDPDDALLIRAIQALANALDQHAQIPEGLKVLDQITLAEAMKLLLMQVAGQLLPPEAGKPAAELLGWLELQADDAPYLLVTGFNEGQIPQSITSHWLLPDTLRKELKLPDNQQRYVRDLYMLKALVHSKKQVDLVAGRTNSRGEPLTPSRLLLTADPSELPEWIERFYGKEHGAQTRRAPLLLLPGVNKSFKVPRPVALDEPITRLSVTAFRDYLACPYRFYLKKCMKLRVLDDRAVELDALAFGSMAHSVLNAMGHTDAGQSTDPAAIADVLTDELARQITKRFGLQPPAVIRVQQEILKQRFEQFAQWQAQSNQKGWRIDQTLLEYNLERELVVDGQPFTIHGRIDRCDHHPLLGHRLLDYKTSDTATAPEKTHRKRDGTWVDLQLPLYHFLAGSLDWSGDTAMGYIHLPRKISDIGMTQADWTSEDLESAMGCATQVIRDIREEKFWPPKEPVHEDEFMGICMDQCLQDAPTATNSQTGQAGQTGEGKS